MTVENELKNLQHRASEIANGARDRNERLTMTSYKKRIVAVENRRTVQSLALYVAPDDGILTRKEFLFTVATRILDDLGISHGLDRACRNLNRR
jgi:hypothetical protein